MRLAIIACTVRSVRPVSGAEAFGEEQAGVWFIGIDCPVDGKSISPVGPFDSWDAANRAIVNNEY